MGKHGFQNSVSIDKNRWDVADNPKQLIYKKSVLYGDDKKYKVLLEYKAVYVFARIVDAESDHAKAIFDLESVGA